MHRRDLTQRNPCVAALGLFSLMILSGLSVQAADPAGSSDLFHWSPFLAPFHSVVLHFPIGFLTVVGILEFYRMIRPSDALRPVIALILWLSLGAGIVAAGFGWMRAGTGGYDLEAVELHRTYGIAVPVMTLATLVFQKLAFRNDSCRIWIGLYRGVLVGTLLLVGVAGHLGGNLTHGANYLVKNAPAFIRELVEPESAAQVQTSGLSHQQSLYVETIMPILKEKCYSCHGPEKQKGGYRLDLPEIALKGGDSGEPAIVPGDPIRSYLVERILLPPDDDDVMPPSGKQALASDEIGMILDWIRKGAAMP